MQSRGGIPPGHSVLSLPVSFLSLLNLGEAPGWVDDWIAIMRDGNNGGYANDWLVGDNKTGEIAQVELGLKHTPVWRTKDGYFHGSNWARDPKVIAEETRFDAKNASSSPNARRARWEQLIELSKGKIDVAFAQKALGDHYDVIEKK